MHPLPHTYKVDFVYKDGMQGELSTAGRDVLPCSAPPEFDGPGTGWSPEALFLNAIAGCVALTFASIAKMMKVEFSEFELAVVGKVDVMDLSSQLEVVL